MNIMFLYGLILGYLYIMYDLCKMDAYNSDVLVARHCKKLGVEYKEGEIL